MVTISSQKQVNPPHEHQDRVQATASSHIHKDESVALRFKQRWPHTEGVLPSKDSYPAHDKYYGDLRIKRNKVTGPSSGRCYINAIGTSMAIILFCGGCLPMLHLNCQLPLSLVLITAILCGTLWIMSMFYLLKGCYTDPGAVPRLRAPSLSYDPVFSFRLYPCPDYVDVVINCAHVRLKWCRTCYIYRPHRGVHCTKCDVCIERFDHHCPWMGNCVGIRNYKYFFVYTTLTTFLVMISSIMTIVGYIYLFQRSPLNWVTSSVLISFTAFIITVGWFPIWIGGYHLKLTSKCETTYEDIKDHYKGNINPYDTGSLRRNLRRLLSRSGGRQRPSYLCPTDKQEMTKSIGNIFEPRAAYWRQRDESSDISQSGESQSIEYSYVYDDELDGSQLDTASVGKSGSSEPFQFEQAGEHGVACTWESNFTEGHNTRHRDLTPNLFGELPPDDDDDDDDDGDDDGECIRTPPSAHSISICVSPLNYDDGPFATMIDDYSARFLDNVVYGSDSYLQMGPLKVMTDDCIYPSVCATQVTMEKKVLTLNDVENVALDR